MLKNIEVTVDDLDGKTPSVKTLVLTVDGIAYELDLGEKNLARLHRALEPFTAVARTVQVKKARKRTTAKTTTAKAAATKPATRRRRKSTEPSPNQIRAWAQENGIEVGAAGRVSKSVKDAFIAAHDAGVYQGKNDKAAEKPSEEILSDVA